MKPTAWRPTVLLACLVAAGSVGPAPASAASPAHLAVRVTPGVSLFDVPLSIRITGLRSGQSTIIRVDSIDAHGLGFASHATYRADSRGVVDPAHQAPKAGTYSGLRPMGLIDSMTTHGGANNLVYFWSRTASQAFTFRVTSGTAHTATTVRRWGVAPGVTVTAATVADSGFVGEFWRPATSTPQPAVLLFGGSEGGLNGQLQGALLASHGYPTLNLAYFGAPGLPATLATIPLEYFTHALNWLAHQPGVDPQHLWILGGSYGGEAALQLAADYPQLVYGAISVAGRNAASCALADCTQSAWSRNGQPVPYSRSLLDPTSTDNPAAIIPVEQARGPILLICAGIDKVSNSCGYAQAIMQRLDTHRYAPPHELLRYDQAGHGIGVLMPYEPGISNPNLQRSQVAVYTANLQGATSASNVIALAQLWPRLLAFLTNPGGATTHR